MYLDPFLSLEGKTKLTFCPLSLLVSGGTTVNITSADHHYCMCRGLSVAL